MKTTNAELKTMYAHKRRPICQAGRANYLIRCDIVFKPRVSFGNIKTHVAEAGGNGFHEHACISKFWEGDVALGLRGDISVLRLFRFVIHLPP